MRTHYEVLGVSPRADLDTIKRAFRQAAKAHHPDLKGGGDAASEHELKMIIVAYKVLRDRDLRAEYDADLADKRQRARRERWDAILQFTAATAVLSAILIGLEILLLPSMGDWLGRPQTTRSVTQQPPSAPPPAAPRDIAAAPPVQDTASVANPIAKPTAPETPLPPAIAEPKPAEAVAATAPTTAASFLKRALERSRQGDLDRAVADFDEAIQLAPRNADIYRYRAKDLGRLGRWDLALADYDSAIRLDPSNPALFRDRGLALQQKGELDEALVDLDRAVRMSFRDAELYSDRGAVWLAKGRYDRALADFNQALKLSPGLAIAAARRDEALERKREQQLAGDERARPSAPETTGTLPVNAAPGASGR
ncbi:J domain-containing protein [Bradyrhizobium sp. HKCCYLS2038]|uniref:J domain-containing protein n=1 Tax=unclassified Bradyrhizobium TaxID=2631580 RepID=UPI003EBA3E48